MPDHRNIFIQAKERKIEDKEISISVCNRIKILLGVLNVIFMNNPYSQYNKDNYEMLIRILHSFLNRNTNIIMNHHCNRNENSHLVFL